MNFAIIHAGPAAPELKRLLKTLDSVGVREKFFMEDLIATLRYEEDFITDLNSMLGEVLYGEYYRHCITHGNVEEFKEYANRYLDDISVLGAKVAKHLHLTLVTQGRYDRDGKFLYEYHNFDGRLISLQCL